MEVQEEIIFFDSIYKTIIDNIDNKKISEEIYQVRSVEEGSVKSNQGGWHSNTIDINAIKEDSHMKTLINTVADVVGQIFDLWKISETFSLDGFWYNINSKGDFNWEHSHPHSKISAVYYVNTSENSGGIVFLRSDNEAGYIFPKEITPYTLKVHRVLPQNGTLLVFPSYLRHRVEVNNDNIERISVAFNFS